MWPDRRVLDLFGIEHPIVLAPMAGAMDWELASAVAEAGGLGSLPCAMLSPEQVREQIGKFRARVQAPLNLNFFCHKPPKRDNAREAAWRDRLKPYYVELGVDPNTPPPGGGRAPFDEAMGDVVAELKPEVVSFHFGLPEPKLFDRVKAAGCKVMASATTATEARWLEKRGVDAVIAQGYEAGGHRGMFLTDNLAAQPGTMALVPQVVDAVKVPVIAAGGIADARGIAAAFALGAAGVQIGTAFLHTPEAKISPMHRKALAEARDDETVLTNVMSGRPSRSILNRLLREVGPISDIAPEFPLASPAVAPLRAAAEKQGSGDFSPLWSGQAGRLGQPLPAAELTRKLAEEAQARLRGLSG
ncbi:MAG: nitronate monooxygenase [Bradyrhizobiaceae bacterium]|nr:nitronate monooxygenase [Bradyrhizobiaceae bacterium]